jgi:hypothetical protein
VQHSSERIVWRVHGTDPSLAPHYFDARLVFHAPQPSPVSLTGEAMQLFMEERVKAEAGGTHDRRLAPFEEALPAGALTLVVRAHSGSGAVDVSLERFDAAGESQGRVWSEGGCGISIIVHTATGTTMTSLPGSNTEASVA